MSLELRPCNFQTAATDQNKLPWDVKQQCLWIVRGYEAAGDTEAYTATKAKYNALSAKYKAFSEAAQLPEQRQRLYTAKK